MNAGRSRGVEAGIDVGIAVLLAALATWLYAATSLHCIYGNDGAMLGDWTALPERAYRQYHNTLYLPCADLLRCVLPTGGVVAADDPLWLAKSLSAIAGGLGLACCYGACRALGSARGSSVFAVVLLAGVQLLILGVMGEYLGRMFLTANQKPQYVVREVLRSESARETADAPEAPRPSPNLTAVR